VRAETKDGNGQHDFDFIAQLLRHQNAMLDVLLHHLAHVEATLFALTLKALPEENLRIAKSMKDHLQRLSTSAGGRESLGL
jgi:hypothetical protein